MEFTFVGAGDSVLARPLPTKVLPGYDRLRDIIAGAGLALTNLEGSTPAEPWFPAYKEDPVHVAYGEGALDDLGALGFDCFCTANNHAGDYGTAGVVDTIRALERRGLPFAGTGMDLQQASAPTYLEVNGGTVAVLAVTASFLPESQAAVSGLGRPGKPGVNMLRTVPLVTLPQEQYGWLCRAVGPEEGSGENPPPQLSLGGCLYQPGPALRTDYQGHPDDLARIASALEQVRKRADYVIVTLHDHLGDNGVECAPQPSRLIRETARGWIDAGADLIFGHGAHQLRPMELHRGRPIFYSTGNFMLDLPGLTRHPAGDLAHFHCADLESYLHFLCSMFQDPASWQSVLPRITFGAAGGMALELYPLQLFHDSPDSPLYGLPTLAGGEEGAAILRRFARLSGMDDGTLVLDQKAGVYRACLSP